MDDHYYTWALRAIGQDLEELSPEYVEIKQKGDDLVARGRYRISDVGRSPSIKRLWEKMLQRDSNAASQKRSVSFVRRYSPRDIVELDQLKQTYRTGLVPTPDIEKLGEMLRTIGRLVDAEAGRLIKLSKDLQTVTFEYRDAEGARRKKQLSSLDLLQDAAAILQYWREHPTHSSDQPDP